MCVVRRVLFFTLSACCFLVPIQSRALDSPNGFLSRIDSIQNKFINKSENKVCSSATPSLALQQACCRLTDSCGAGTPTPIPATPLEQSCATLKGLCAKASAQQKLAEALYKKLENDLDKVIASISRIYDRTNAKIARLRSDLAALEGNYSAKFAECQATSPTDPRAQRAACREADRLKRRMTALQARIERLQKLADDTAAGRDQAIERIQRLLDAANQLLIATGDEADLVCTKADIVCDGDGGVSPTPTPVPDGTPGLLPTPTPTPVVGRCFIEIQGPVDPYIGRVRPPPIRQQVLCSECVQLVEAPALPHYDLPRVGPVILPPPHPYPACQIVH